MDGRLNLEIRDCGSINHAYIGLNRINVIGGVNGSGKSTVSKILYSFLRANASYVDEKYLLKMILPSINEIINISRNPKLIISSEKFLEILSLNEEGEKTEIDLNQIIKEKNFENFTVEDDISDIINDYQIAKKIILNNIFVSENIMDYEEGFEEAKKNNEFLINSDDPRTDYKERIDGIDSLMS